MKNFLFIISLFTFISVNAQIQQEFVIASTGGFGSQTAGTAYYTVGEMSMIKTFSVNGQVLTQGFLQGSIVGNTNNGGFALPVTLLDFSGYYSASVDHLAWQTASEVNNVGFNVERMNSSGDFQSIGYVTGAGTTEVEQTYSLDDKQPMPGINYYRLKQVDLDGNFTYSGIISITAPATNIMTVSISPNPALSYVNITIATSEDRSGMLLMTDIVGKTVYREPLAVTTGTNLAKIDLSGYESGQYFVKYTTNTGSNVFKLVKQ